MILVTIGSAEPFDRLLRAVAQIDVDEDLVVQCGSSRLRLERARCVPFLPFDELRALMGSARVVVTHAGVGSVLTTLGVGRIPVVMPRLRRLGEAVDDHQLRFATRLAEAGLATVVFDADRLDAAVRIEPSAAQPVRESPLAEELRAIVQTVLGCSQGSATAGRAP